MKMKTSELTRDDLWRLLNLAEEYADRCDDDAETYETYTALAAKVHNIIKETEK